MSRTKQQQQQLIVWGCIAAATAVSVYAAWYVSSSSRRSKSLPPEDEHVENDLPAKTPTTTIGTPRKEPHTTTTTTTVPAKDGAHRTNDTDPTPRRDNTSSSSSSSSSSGNTTTATTATTTTTDPDKTVHAKIEALDQVGKQHFKDKQYLDAAQAFTEALNYLASQPGLAAHEEMITLTSSESSSTTTTTTTTPPPLSNLLRQQVTLLNNRSAMYEKAEIYDLALEDCRQILDLEATHTKARIRKLRIYEVTNDYHQALVEICAIQLLFMQTNRLQLQMNLPVPSPPIPQSKMEDVLNQILPTETLKYVNLLNERNQQVTPQALPGHYTILQLLRSYTEYNAWMAQAAADGTVAHCTTQLLKNASRPNNNNNDDDESVVVARITWLFRRGRRHVYDRHYEEASVDFEAAYRLLQEQPDSIGAKLPDNIHARLLEWTGMVRHWHYALDDALVCLQQAAALEPHNALLVVKQAGVQLDAGQQPAALKLFEQALQIDPNSVDALLHRSNLRIMQNQPELAKTDLETCIKLRPGHTMARLRLASILVPLEDMDGAKRQIDLAERSEPNSSEVHSYRGEWHFAQGQMEEARRAFEKAIQLEPFNPTPYVNAAMAVINTPPAPGQMPDTAAVVRLLEEAIRVDPQFSAAYVHLGQLKLGTATTLVAAREVVGLYDTALEKCRTPEEMKDLCGMRVLAVAQVQAAEQLKMETFNLN